MEMRRVGLELLVGHRWRGKESSGRVRRLLAKHIAATGCYEPLVVRAMGRAAGDEGGDGAERFEILHGHTRAEVLRGLGYRKALCVVWGVTEVEVLRWLATVHQVGDKEKASRRLALLGELLKREPPERLAEWVMEDVGTLGKLEEVGSSRKGKHAMKRGKRERPEAFTVFLSGEEKRVLRERLRGVDEDLGRALMMLVRGVG